MRHNMRVVIDDYNGLWAEPVCVDHDQESCGQREVFFWDSAASMENYQGKELVLADFPISITEVSEENGFVWEVRSDSC